MIQHATRWLTRLWQRATRPRCASLHDASADLLRDLGVDRSEIASVQAEARGLASPSRLRVVLSCHALGPIATERTPKNRQTDAPI